MPGKHISDGELRAYNDNQMAAEELQAASKHLDSCLACHERLQAAEQQAEQMQKHFSLLEPAAVHPISISTARHRLTGFISRKESSTMLSRIFSRRYRAAWAAAVVLLILGVSLTFPPVQAIANSFLGLFRVQHITVVQVNPGNLPNQLGSSSTFEAIMSKDIQHQQHGEKQAAASQQEAAQLANLPVRLPTTLQGKPTFEVTPGETASIKIDLQQIRAVLQEIGRSDIQLPDGLDGSTITVDVPKGVLASYGDCKFDPANAAAKGYDPDNQTMPRLPNCTTLMQIPSPTISAPEGLDVQKLGEAYLQLLGMSRQDAQQFAKNVDWSSTFVIPIPSRGTSYSQVPVDGVTGTLIRQEGENQYMLIWVKDGIVYALTGPGSNGTAISTADSLK